MEPYHKELHKAAYMWFVNAQASSISLSGVTMQQKALNYACLLGTEDFKARTRWLDHFKALHGIFGKVLSGKSAAADDEVESKSIVYLQCRQDQIFIMRYCIPRR